MISVLLTVLKVLGILILSLLGIVILLLLLVLFVLVRYRIYAERKLESGLPVLVRLKATWLLHLLNVHFSYPEEAYIKVRIGCFTVFRSDRTKEKKEKAAKKEKNKKKDLKKQEEKSRQEESKEEAAWKETSSKETEKTACEEEVKKEKEEKKKKALKDEKPTVRSFFKKFLAILGNLRYTITQICDKIKKIVKNIKYYMELISSEEFKGAFRLCHIQAGALLKHIRPRKIKGRLLIGTGDPASTGQALAIYGMLYPFLGDQITVTPDFEQQIVEGELFIKGRITLFRVIRCAWIIYFNKDLRKVINMLKREAV